MLKIAINRPITTVMIFIAMLLFGVFALFSLPVNLYPNVNIPIIKITAATNAELGYIESKITRKIEDAAASVSGIDKIQSQSFDNFSVVVVVFKLGRDLDQAADDLREKLGSLHLPVNPSVEKISSDAGQVLGIFAAPKHASEQLKKGSILDEISQIKTSMQGSQMAEFMRQIDEDIKPSLARAGGIGEVKLRGFYQPEISIKLHKAALAQRKLDAASVAALLQARNIKSFLGELENGAQIITAKGEFAPESIEELGQIQLADGLFLKDVASIEYGAAKRNDFVYYKGAGVMLELSKVSGQDTLKSIKAAKNQLETLRKKYPQIEFRIAYDKSFLIIKHLKQVVFDMVFGVFLTIIIVFCFLRSASATLLASLAIPISIVASFGLIYLFGYDLNRLTLIALTLAIGIFIDDAIVVIERIVHRADEKTNALHASYLATREIIFSVFAISVVLLCVFIPISFMNSIPGLFFNTLGMSVSFGIIISFLTCVFLVPTLAARLLNTRKGALASRTERYFLALESGYERALKYVINRKLAFGALIIAACLGAVALVPKIGLDFLPMEDDGELFVELESLQDLPLDAMAARAIEFEQEILERNPSVQYATLKVAYDDAKDRKKAQIYVRLKPLDERLNKIRQKAFVQTLRAKLAEDKTATTRNLRAKLIEVPKFEGAGVDDPIQYELLGDDLATLAIAASELKTELAKLNGVVDIADNQSAALRVLRIGLDAQAASRAGVSALDISRVLQSALAKAAFGHLQLPNRAVDIRLQLSNTQALDTLKGLQIRTKRGMVDVLSLLKITVVDENSIINHSERKRSIKITAATEGALDLGTVKNHLDSAAASVLEKHGLEHEWRGFIDLLGQTVSGFVTVIILAAVLIYLVLAALYESLIMPLIIMLTMPLAFVGAATALYLAGFSFSLFVLVALILLFGMVGKNAILLIDVAMKGIRSGLCANDALIIAGRSRIRAILMTTLAMIGAMAPLALSHGSGYEANAPMAVAVIGGLISSTLLTLFVIPLLFSAAARADAALRRLYERESI